jgi:ArsR family transcriptional regulator
MKNKTAIEVLSALAQPTRLDAFRLLVKHEPAGLPAGEMARLLEVPHNTLSTHLAILTRSGLLSVERHSRSMIYRAHLQAVRQLVAFLLEHCCNGQPELCAPLFQELAQSRSTPGACRD